MKIVKINVHTTKHVMKHGLHAFSDGGTDACLKSKIDIGIKEEDRAQIAQGLSRLLADTYTLYLKTHNFHWNVKGPMFQPYISCLRLNTTN